MTEEQIQEEFVPRFRQGPRTGPTTSWVVENSARLFRRVMRLERLYFGLRHCRVKEYLGISRCFRCQGLGHIGKCCKRQVACSRRGEEGHIVGRCKRGADVRRCANCVRAGLRSVDHAVGWLGCPALLLQKRRLKDITEYD